MNILDLPMGRNDAEAATVLDYMKALLTTLWEEEDSFSGKHPFGNSGWQYEVYAALVKGGAIEGALDEYGNIETCDKDKGNELILEAIKSLCATSSHGEGFED